MVNGCGVGYTVKMLANLSFYSSIICLPTIMQTIMKKIVNWQRRQQDDDHDNKIEASPDSDHLVLS